MSYQITDTSEENKKIINEVVDLWNSTQEFLSPVVYVDRYLLGIILNAYKELGIDTIKTLFEKVNKTPKLNGTKNKDYHTSIDYVLITKNAAKILNGDYDEIEIQEKEQDITLATKLVYYRAKQNLGIYETDQGFEDKYKFTDYEKQKLKDSGRFIQGRYIANESIESES